MKNTCRSIDYDPNKILVGCCEKQAGGFKKPSAPVFTPRITNTVDSCEVSQFWAEETFELIITDDEQFIQIDNSCEADGPDPFGIFPGCGACAILITEADAFWVDEDFVFVVQDDNQNYVIDNR